MTEVHDVRTYFLNGNLFQAGGPVAENTADPSLEDGKLNS